MKLALTLPLSLIIIAAAATLLPADAQPADRPNILWLTSEDNNIDWVGAYGNPHADTPNIDQLAREGFRYTNVFANAPVCAPSRSTWITGIHALSTGTHHMRSRYPIPHQLIKYYPDFLKANGYYVGNDTKTDYNIGGRQDADCWDNPKTVDWDQLTQRQPFFQVINFNESHESRAQGEVDSTLHDPADTRLRAYHPDVPDIRKNYAKYHDAVKRMDTDLGAALKRLDELGLAENTIVIHNSDHGGVLPRSKRFLFQTGLHCPLIIRIPEKYKHLWPADAPGTTVDRLVSFIDMPKTWLSLTGSPIPGYMQGTIFLGPDQEPERPYHFAFRGRMDERIDNARAVTDGHHLYIRNYMPQVPWMQHLNYLWQMKATRAWEEQVASGHVTEIQSRYFQPKRWSEELYDMREDPDNVRNLADDPAQAGRLHAMRQALRSWQLEIRDAGLLPESELVARAEAHRLTPYELVRDPRLYDLPGLLDAADLALAQDPAHLPRLRALLQSEDSGKRYWAIVGAFLLGDQPSGAAALDDESDEVRAVAAWLAIKTGPKEAGLAVLRSLIANHSPASLSALNIIDLIGDDAQALVPTIQAVAYGEDEGYEARMQIQLLEKYGLATP